MQGADIDFVVPYQDAHPDIDFMHIKPALPYAAAQLGGAYDTPMAIQVAGSVHNQQAAYAHAVQKLITHKKYDVIHAHDWLTFKAGQIAKQQLQVPLVAHVHATEFDRAGQRRGNPLVHEIEQQVLSFADKVVAVSQATKDIIVRNYHIPATQIAILHNSIDPQAFEPLEPAITYKYIEQMKQRGYTVVVSLGRLTIQKGLIYLLQAAKLVLERRPKTLFLIAGTGDQYHELVELCADLGIAEQVLFTGVFTGGKAQRDAFAMANIFVMPSVSEPFGIAALEAVGSGSIALVSKQSGVGEVLHNLMKFDYWDTKRLAEQILAIAEYASLRTTLQSSAYDEFRQLSWRKVADSCQELYTQVAVKVPA
jgi:glycosyltransferase involved in cell wall biosynthesis